MLNGTPAVIPDIYADARIPAEAYRPTFVKSLAMVPIRRGAPIGAIGNYWAEPYEPPREVVAVLQALADTISIAMENAQLYGELTKQVAALEEANGELSRFAWVASHDLQEPLRTIVTQVEMLARRYGDQLDERAKGYIDRAAQGATRLQDLIAGLLTHTRAERIQGFRPLALDDVLKNVLDDLGEGIASSGASIDYGALPRVLGDAALLGRLLQNLLTNALKFQHAGTVPRILIRAEPDGKSWRIRVSDNGIGVAGEYREKVFGLFQRLNSQDAYPGSGIGLATCRKIVELHGGRIWIDRGDARGTDICFTLPDPESAIRTQSRPHE
ncbi:MAG: ATP-binding protein [Alphaproteobacteria bacterium]